MPGLKLWRAGGNVRAGFNKPAGPGKRCYQEMGDKAAAGLRDIRCGAVQGPVERVGSREVLAHGARSRIAIMGGHCVDDTLVFRERQRLGAGCTHDASVVLARPLEQGLDDGGKNGISADACQFTVEGHVARQEKRRVVLGLALFFQAGLQALDVVRRRIGGGELRHPAFQKHTRALQVFQRVRVRAQQMLRTGADLLNQALRGRDHDPRALAVRDFNDPGAFQRLERLANGWSTYTVVLHEIALGGQLFAWGDLAVADALG